MKINKIILHHTATDTGTFASIKRHHIKERGFNDIAYHYLITTDGKVYKGREEHIVGAHTLGQNDQSLGICLVGNFDHYKPNEAQIKALVTLIKELWNKHGKLPVHGHNEFAAKSCPGKMFPWSELKALLEDHWAEKFYQSLLSKGMIIHDRRFNDKITRGEVFALLDQLKE